MLLPVCPPAVVELAVETDAADCGGGGSENWEKADADCWTSSEEAEF